MATTRGKKSSDRRGAKAAGDELVDRVEKTREELHGEARRRLGVTGTDERTPPLRQVLRDHGIGIYPLFALSVLGIVDTFQSYAFRVLAPEVGAALGIGVGTVSALIALKTLPEALGPLGIAALTGQRARRALIIIVTGVFWSIVAIATGFVTATIGLAVVLVLDGITTASVQTLHPPVLLDSYPPEGRVRALSYWVASGEFGSMLAPLLVGLFSAVLGFSWRGVFIVLGAISFVSVFAALRLRDPGYGRWDTEQVRNTVREKETGQPVALEEANLDRADVELGFFEIIRRLMLIPTIKRLLAVEIAFGFFAVPFDTFLAFFLDERWNLGPGGRALFAAFLALCSVVSLSLFGRRGEAMFQKDPGRVIYVSSWLIAIAVVFICSAALVPTLALVLLFFGLANGLLAALGPSLGIAILSVIPSGMRPHATAILVIAIGIGGIAGSLLLGGVANQYGITGSMVALVVPGVVGALILRSAAKLVSRDLDRMIDETIEDEEIKQITRAGGTLPMLSCRKIDFAYEHVQVLFGVDFTVDEGEMVALLGTNGAGKSTLLKVVSGIGLPLGGSVRFRGADITYLDAERRLRLGITQIPGGRAVFGPMDVVENLRVFGYSLGRKKRLVDEAIETSFAAFPRLAERRNQKASTLSGGEQQMLGLAKALMLRPKLLLIDELSLGLAPVIVSQLFDMVKQINEQGSAVVLVEQSVNIALNLAEHAYFMEKGEIRFDGASRTLLQRDDLLRAVFLEGAKRAELPRSAGGPGGAAPRDKGTAASSKKR